MNPIDTVMLMVIGTVVAHALMAVLVLIKDRHLAPWLPRLRRSYFRDWYYPGGRLMSLWCWLQHPVSKTKRAEAEFSAGLNWPDPDVWGLVSTGERNS